jgi:hypothetical protein
MSARPAFGVEQIISRRECDFEIAGLVSDQMPDNFSVAVPNE